MKLTIKESNAVDRLRKGESKSGDRFPARLYADKLYRNSIDIIVYIESKNLEVYATDEYNSPTIFTFKKPLMKVDTKPTCLILRGFPSVIEEDIVIRDIKAGVYKKTVKNKIGNIIDEL